MKKSTLLISMLLCLAMAFAFAGCGGSTDMEDETVSDDAAEYDAGVIAAGEVLSFETKDLEGNPVSSEELFAKSDVTMLNIWGTYCGPCINEMPEIETINQEYAEKGAAVVGLVCDVSDTDDSCLQDAFDIIQDTGVTYTSLYWNDEIESQLNLSAVPTTIFVDKEGTVLGEAVIGAYPNVYRTALDQYLAGE